MPRLRGGRNGPGEIAVAEAVDCFDGGAAFAEFFAELGDMLIEGAGCAEIVCSPEFVKEMVTGENFAGMFGEDTD